MHCHVGHHSANPRRWKPPPQSALCWSKLTCSLIAKNIPLLIAYALATPSPPCLFWNCQLCMESLQFSRVLALLHRNVLYQEGQLSADHIYNRHFYLVCTAHWMDPWQWRKKESFSGTVYSETMPFDSIYHKTHFHFLSILGQSWILWQDTSTMRQDS